ncbi:hypothetical protein [Microcoleus sp. CAWBG58]|uniref:hypothetical protein n=1 Tax=Microcoleus sp. CAWBG58 TaxID=2841651 RepID=UPI0025D1C4CA|nr:hypothetical protein [Microcoleus sp. CAWBG58]
MLIWHGFVERFSNTLLALGAFGKRSFAVVSSRIYSHESDKRALFITPILGLLGRGRSPSVKLSTVNCQLSTVNCLPIDIRGNIPSNC